MMLGIFDILAGLLGMRMYGVGDCFLLFVRPIAGSQHGRYQSGPVVYDYFNS
jgi:hypothetical protein